MYCPSCRSHFATLPDEEGDHGCPRCGLMEGQRDEEMTFEMHRRLDPHCSCSDCLLWLERSSNRAIKAFDLAAALVNRCPVPPGHAAYSDAVSECLTELGWRHVGGGVWRREFEVNAEPLTVDVTVDDKGTVDVVDEE